MTVRTGFGFSSCPWSPGNGQGAAGLSSRYAVCELLLSGVTTVMDMYYFEDAVAEVMDQMGIRGIAGETVMEEASCDARTPREAIMLGEGMIKRYRNHPRIKGCIAPHGTTTCGSSTLQEIHGVNHEYGVPFTLHVAEMDYEITYLKEQYGCTPIEYLDGWESLTAIPCAHTAYAYGAGYKPDGKVRQQRGPLHRLQYKGGQRCGAGKFHAGTWDDRGAWHGWTGQRQYLGLIYTDEVLRKFPQK